MSYQNLLIDFLKDDLKRKYAANILNKLTAQYRHGYIAEAKRKGWSFFVDESEKIIAELVNDATGKTQKKRKRYTSSIFPTIISPEMAPNFWFKDEREPTAEEIYRLLYLILTGLYQRNYVINLENINFSIRERFREWLIRKEALIVSENGGGGGIDLSKVLSELHIHGFPISEFGFSLLMVSYFASWLKNQMESYPKWAQFAKEMGVSWTLPQIGIEDTATLVVYNLHRQKKEMYIIPRLKDFVVRWYEEFLTGKEDSVFLLSFLSSLYVRHKDYRKIIDKTMNQFIYYLLRGYVNGELLANMINIKIKYELKGRKRRPYPIQKVKAFLRKI